MQNSNIRTKQEKLTYYYYSNNFTLYSGQTRIIFFNRANLGLPDGAVPIYGTASQTNNNNEMVFQNIFMSYAFNQNDDNVVVVAVYNNGNTTYTVPVTARVLAYS